MTEKKKLIIVGFIIGVILSLLFIKYAEACFNPPTCEETQSCEVTPSPEVTPEVTPEDVCPEEGIQPTGPCEAPEVTPEPTTPPAGHGDGASDGRSDNRSDGGKSSDFEQKPVVTLAPCTASTCGWK